MLTMQMVLHSLDAYMAVGASFSLLTALQMLLNKEAANAVASPWDQVISLLAIVIVWPAVLLAMWDDNQDGPWRG